MLIVFLELSDLIPFSGFVSGHLPLELNALCTVRIKATQLRAQIVLILHIQIGNLIQIWLSKLRYFDSNS